MRQWLKLLAAPVAFLLLVFGIVTQSLLLGIALTVITVLTLFSVHLIGQGAAQLIGGTIDAAKQKDWNRFLWMLFYFICCFIGIFLVFGFGVGLTFVVLGL